MQHLFNQTRQNFPEPGQNITKLLPEITEINPKDTAQSPEQ